MIVDATFAQCLESLMRVELPAWTSETRKSMLNAKWIQARGFNWIQTPASTHHYAVTQAGREALATYNRTVADAKWGLTIEWTARGLLCCDWLQWSDGRIMEFADEVDARDYANDMPGVDYDRILAPQQLTPKVT